jgi:hypothetical protein
VLIARPTSRTVVIAAAVTLLSSPVPAGAQPQCSARTFTACGVRIEKQFALASQAIQPCSDHSARSSTPCLAPVL